MTWRTGYTLRVAGSLCALSVGLATTACDEQEHSDCHGAANHFMSARAGLAVGTTWHPTARAIESYCTQSSAEAQELGCTAAHGAFVSCLAAVGPALLTGWNDSCTHEASALEACLHGAPFEASCTDGEDDDADGRRDCADPDCDTTEACLYQYGPEIFPQNAIRDIDLLFVVDNSASMGNRQLGLRLAFPALMSELNGLPHGPPNLHVGITSTDLGVGDSQIPTCERAGGDGGRLLTNDCANPVGDSPYLVDIAPEGCNITRDAQGICSAHDCDVTHCTRAPTATLENDALTGCPRCRNFTGEALSDVFSCMSALGTQGRGFEQPLEAMRKALDPGNTTNQGFVREEATLVVVLLTDEDDCSAADPRLFDTSETDINSTLGPLTAFRCFEHAVTCDIDSRTYQGTRHACEPRDDAETFTHPIGRYTEFLDSLKWPGIRVVAVLAGPVTASPEGVGVDVEVGLDDQNNPEVQYSCTSDSGGAKPGVRLHRFATALNTPSDLERFGYSSACASDFTPALQRLGQRLTGASRCFAAPLAGCSDVGVEFGVPRASVTCAANERCVADCEVIDMLARGSDDEIHQPVPPCLEVLPDGTHEPGNRDRARAYAQAHPAERDSELPVTACWHIGYAPGCPESGYATLVVSRRQTPPPLSFTAASCRQLPLDEHDCNDALDNDEDCLTDAEDPCCQDFSCQLDAAGQSW